MSNIRMTSYKYMAPSHAVRLETSHEPDFNKLVDVDHAKLLRNFWEWSRYEYPAIYYWIED